MHSTVAYTAQTPSQRASSQSVRSAVCSTAVRSANREAVDVLGGNSMILVCIFTPLKSLVSSAVHGTAAESCKRRGARSKNLGAGSPWSAASLARPTRSAIWWGEAPERPNGFSEGEALNGYVLTPRHLPSRGSMACFCFMRCDILDPRLGTVFGLMSRSATAHFRALLVIAGHLGALPHQGSAAMRQHADLLSVTCDLSLPRSGLPCPTRGSDRIGPRKRGSAPRATPLLAPGFWLLSPIL
jgi:hypothetical protein